MKKNLHIRKSFRNHLSILGLIVLMSNLVLAQNIVNIDFGGTETEGWNNLDGAKGDTIANLETGDGSLTGIELILHDAFNGTNTAGTSTADPALGIPASASGDSFFGNTGDFQGFTEPTGGVTFSNLIAGTPYTFTIFGSRAATDNRETQFDVQGMSLKTETIQVASNTSEVAIITMMPAADRTITVVASPGPNNDNSLGFYYLGAIKIAYEGDVTPPELGGVLLDDFEDSDNTIGWTAFGNGAFGDSTFSIVENPIIDDINESDNVRNWQKAMGAQSFAGEYTDVDGKIAFTDEDHHICIKVLFDHIGTFRVKMESPLNGGPGLSIKVPNTKMGEWEEICLDFSNDDSGNNGIGYDYSRITLMFDHGDVPTEDQNYYFDDLKGPLAEIVIEAEPVGPLIDDFEDANNTLEFTAFGNAAFGDSTFAIVPNPTIDSGNSSANVRNWQKAMGAQSFAGEYADFAADNQFIEFTEDDHHICVKVLYDHIGTFRIKMESPIDGGPGLSIKVPNTKMGEWEEICLDFSNDDSGKSGVGFRYSRLTFMFDHGDVPTEDLNYYFDDVRIGSPLSGPPIFMEGGKVVFDWETPESSSQPDGSFGNGHFSDSLFMKISNPNSSGINTSANVYEWCKAADGNEWAGFYFDPAEPFDFTGIDAKVCMNVLMDHAGTVRLKMENSDTGNPDVSHNADYVTPNEWQQVCFDYTQPDGNENVGSGSIYTRMTVFFDFGAIAADACYQFDDVVKFEGGFVDPGTGRLLSDWETPETTVDITASFGNGHFGTDKFGPVDNPNPSGDNTSATVYEWCKADDALNFGGFVIGVDTLDFTGTDATICISVMSETASNLRLKVEGSETGPDTRIQQDYTTPGEWQQLCFDFNKDGVDGNNASGAIYSRIAFFPNYPDAPAQDQCFYFDDLFTITNGSGEVRSTIGELIAESPDHTKLSEFLTAGDIWSAVNAVGVTVIAPTDAAFAAMDPAQLDAWTNNTNNMLFDGLLHHVILAEVSTDDMAMGNVYLAGNGQDATVTAGNSAMDGASISEGDIDASNGILHITDEVMTLPPNPQAGYVFMDNETEATTLEWTWTPATIVPNPSPGGINSSANVANFIKTPGGPWWQGSVTELRRIINLRSGVQEVCVDMLADHPAFVRMKMERPITPLPDAGGTQATYLTFETGLSIADEWTQICSDVAIGTFRDGDNVTHELPGATHMFSKPVFFLDYIDAPLPADTVHYYIDNFISKRMVTSTNDLDKLENFTMYPNPTSNTLTITTDSPVSKAIIFNSSGTRMMEVAEPKGRSIDVSDLQLGLYFIGLQDEFGNYLGTAKFVKK